MQSSAAEGAVLFAVPSLARPVLARLPALVDPAPYVVLHQDETLLVVDKAAGWLTLPAPGLTERTLLDELQADGFVVQPIHRLDKDTSGVLLFGLDPRRRDDLERAFRERTVRKSYLAVVQGRLPAPSGLIDLPIRDEGATARVARDGKPARTRFTALVEFAGRATLVRAEPETGRHNQIRVHLAHVGCPLLGDGKFGRRSQRDSELPAAGRALLHAERLAFTHPATGRPLELSCAPPADFVAVREALAQRWEPRELSPPASSRGSAASRRGGRGRGTTSPGRGKGPRRRR